MSSRPVHMLERNVGTDIADRTNTYNWWIRTQSRPIDMLDLLIGAGWFVSAVGSVKGI